MSKMSALRACGTVNTRVEVGRGEQLRALRFHPLGRGPCLTRWDSGDSGTSYRHSAQSRTADTVPHAPRAAAVRQARMASMTLLLGRGDRMGLPVGVAIEAEDVGDFPRWPVGAWLAVPVHGDSAPVGRHGLTPLAALGRSSATPSRSNGLWTLARCCRVMWRERVVVSMVRWPSRSWMVRRSTPASKQMRGKTMPQGMDAFAVGDPSEPLGVGVDLLRGGDGQGLGAVLSRKEPRRRGGRVASRPAVRPADGPTAAWSGPCGLCPD